MPKKKKIRDWTEWAGPFAAAIATLCVTYILASWAIDSGRIFAYVLSFIGTYYSLHFSKEAIKNFFK